MSDSQWPRYEVFQQEREGRPHQNVGSVHAPDAELALQNARDVFVRRPRTASLWLVPAEAILACTSQQLTEGVEAGSVPEPSDPGQPEAYHVFQKQSQRRTMGYVTHTGAVQATSPQEALAKAIAQYSGGKETYVWWICPERAILRSEEQDVTSLFSPAEDKAYRMPQEYRVLSEMLEVKAQDETGEAE
jgi:ring-1,2-phenylacetyl-CoA epoxidase subunit PaaB